MYNFENIDPDEKKKGPQYNKDEPNFWERMYVASQAGELSDYEQEQVKIAVTKDPRLAKKCLEIKILWNLMAGGFKYLSFKGVLKPSQRASALKGKHTFLKGLIPLVTPVFYKKNLVVGGSFAALIASFVIISITKVSSLKNKFDVATDSRVAGLTGESHFEDNESLFLEIPPSEKFGEESIEKDAFDSVVVNGLSEVRKEIQPDPLSSPPEELSVSSRDSFSNNNIQTRGYSGNNKSNGSDAEFESAYAENKTDESPQPFSGGTGGGAFYSSKDTIDRLIRLPEKSKELKPDEIFDTGLGEITSESFYAKRQSESRANDVTATPRYSQDKWFSEDLKSRSKQNKSPLNSSSDFSRDVIEGSINPFDFKNSNLHLKKEAGGVNDVSKKVLKSEVSRAGASVELYGFSGVLSDKAKGIRANKPSPGPSRPRIGRKNIDDDYSDQDSDNLKSISGKFSPKQSVEKSVQYGGKKYKVIPPASELEPHPETETSDNALSTFSLNVSDVSFRLSQAAIANGNLPDKSSIRSEEFINAFDYKDPAPGSNQKVGITSERALWPFEMNREVIRLGVKANQTGLDLKSGMNLVILLDTSGSMQREDRVRTVNKALFTLVNNLGASDSLTLVGFARVPRLLIDGMPGGNADAFLSIVGAIRPSGGTNIEAALELAYEKLFERYRLGGNNRILLLTDGAANLGEIDGPVLASKIEKNRIKGAILDCFGIGWDGYDDALLERLTRDSDGKYGFLNSAQEASSYFKETWYKSVEVSAKNVKVQIEFNTNRISRYRQMGYQKHRLTARQFRDNAVNAGEIGKAESGSAIYIVEVKENGSGPVGWVRVRYQDPLTLQYDEIKKLIPYRGPAPSIDLSSGSLKLASAAGSFAEWLGGNPYAAQVDVAQLESWVDFAISEFAPDDRPLLLKQMIQNARSLRP